ncbi:hypothetical protein UPYG_G00247180 [Umbra pygmaea]|uniref:Uncharacterized protein n=1 Tax=Umbra pygmaea TaxID=75934 RepID=A0ABD0WI37_UMBPY
MTLKTRRTPVYELLRGLWWRNNASQGVTRGVTLSGLNAARSLNEEVPRGGRHNRAYITMRLRFLSLHSSPRSQRAAQCLLGV